MRYGLGWRRELGASILAHLDEIDVVEVLAEELTRASANEKCALRFLATQVEVVVHGTSLGLASTEDVDRKRLDAIARVLDWLQPRCWSEHLAFVRGGGLEVGHLAAPPRNDAMLEGLQRNIATAAAVTGSRPQLENVASLIDPPLSTYDEGSWLRAVADTTGCELLLDLHNLHANATNFHFDAGAVIAALPHDRIGAIHLAGGRRIEGDRILDDHLHDVPDPVFALLAFVDAPDAAVILERDGNYPQFEELLPQLRRARAVVPAALPALSVVMAPSGGSDAAVPFLARLYVDEEARARFLEAPVLEAQRAGLDLAAARELAAIDRDSLALAARSFARKRALKHEHGTNRTG